MKIRYHPVIFNFLFLLFLITCGGGGGTGGGTGEGTVGENPPPSASSNADLASLAVSNGVMNPSFDPSTTTYTSMFIGRPAITITPKAADAGAKITVNGTAVTSGQASQSISLNPGANTVTVIVTAADGVTTKHYAVTANFLSQEAYVKASNTNFNDNFGFCVSLSGDTLAVGARSEAGSATGVNGNQADNSAIDSGAVYVFTRAATTWSQQAYIKASNTNANDQFGSSVSLSGDTLAVGAPFENGNAIGINGNEAAQSAADSGAVYVFTRAAEAWSQQAYIKASNTNTMDYFGTSVSLAGNILAVGAPGEASGATGTDGNQADNSANASGAVYVLR